MADDELMDRLLKSVMTSEVPQLSPGFEAAVLRRVGRRRLSGPGRVVMAAYGLAAAAATVWLTQGLEPAVVGAGLTIGLATVLAASAYVQRLVRQE